MKCPHCETDVRIRKSLRRGKSQHPDECPECGEAIESKSKGILEK